jgi:hypothetical protein
MQYKKLGLSRLLKFYGSQQVPYSQIMNRSEVPNFSYCQPLAFVTKNPLKSFFQRAFYLSNNPIG